MKCQALALLLGGGLLGCSGHYEVGRMDPQSSGGATAGSGGSGTTMVAMGLGGSTSTAGEASASGGNEQVDAPVGGELGTACVPSGMPAPLTGPFLTPQEVWTRISLAVRGESSDPPSPLPEQTSYDWAGRVVSQLFDEAVAQGDAAPGADVFLQSWLGLAADAGALSPTWGHLLAADPPALEVLLITPMSDARRIGVFSEQAWLKQYASISMRGFVMAQSVMGDAVPPEPAGVNNQPNGPAPPGYTRRQALAANVDYPSCAACHQIFDPLGLSLEHFDDAGAFRTLDANQPVDSSGTYLLRHSGREISFSDVGDLGHQLADTCDANLGFASDYLALGLTRMGVLPTLLGAVHDAELPRFQQAFVAGGRSYRALVMAFAQSSAVLER
ncbi:MAG TPA: DUF1588 domain-containing protein [Polyangiaceae bacterium]|nr:DUF1588 domain-containing protein [Polyangiaceae bacterium]